MTGSRDIEGMLVFPVGRVMNAWLIEEVLFAFTLARPYLAGAFYYYFGDTGIIGLLKDL